jgi:hypothetical protein
MAHSWYLVRPFAVKQKLRLWIRFALLLGLFVSQLLSSGRASAAPATGITISPAKQDLTLQQTQKEINFPINLVNHNQAAQHVALSLLDFGSLNETGGLIFEGASTAGAQTRYSLQSWLTFDRDNVVLQPNQKQVVTATITNKQSLAPGGHYGAVTVTLVDDDKSAGKKQLELLPSSSVLVFLKKTGGEHYELNLKQTSQNGGLLRLPDSVNLRFQNGGNVHAVPRGIVSVYDGRGRMVSRGIINSDSGIIMPESFRRYPVALNALGHPWLPGRYAIHVDYHYDGNTTVKSSVVKFYYLGNFLYLILAILCIAVLCYVVKKSPLWRKLIHSRGKTGA